MQHVACGHKADVASFAMHTETIAQIWRSVRIDHRQYLRIKTQVLRSQNPRALVKKSCGRDMVGRRHHLEIRKRPHQRDVLIALMRWAGHNVAVPGTHADEV